MPSRCREAVIVIANHSQQGESPCRKAREGRGLVRVDAPQAERVAVSRRPARRSRGGRQRQRVRGGRGDTGGPGPGQRAVYHAPRISEMVPSGGRGGQGVRQPDRGRVRGGVDKGRCAPRGGPHPDGDCWKSGVRASRLMPASFCTWRRPLRWLWRVCTHDRLCGESLRGSRDLPKRAADKKHLPLGIWHPSLTHSPSPTFVPTELASPGNQKWSRL